MCVVGARTILTPASDPAFGVHPGVSPDVVREDLSEVVTRWRFRQLNQRVVVRQPVGTVIWVLQGEREVTLYLSSKNSKKLIGTNN